VRLVLDTNIVMDLLYFLNPDALRLDAAIQEKRITCFTDAACFAEVERVCAYPSFGLSVEQQRRLLENYRRRVRFCNPAEKESDVSPRCHDEDDQKFLQLAARCRADLLLTRDKELLRLSAGCKSLGFSIAKTFGNPSP
jgi:putative PIN family toxin of toxin-antitoxin system